MNVLYLHPAAAFGGASKSLIELYALLHQEGVRGTVLTPEGVVCQSFAEAGMDVRAVRGLSQFDNTRYGYYRKIRWIIPLRELFLLPSSLLGLWRLRKQSFDLIHINEITLLPLGLLARWLFRVPLIVHVRSLQRKPAQGLRTRWVNALLRRYADAVVAIDHTVASTLAADLKLSVIHNGLKISPTAPTGQVKRDDDVVSVGFLGGLIPLKGIFELVESMRILKHRGVRIQCLIAGENARQLSGLKAWVLGKFGFARDVHSELEEIIRREQLGDQVKLLGFVGDVRSLYPQLDILCFPTHLDAAGRPVFEAAFYSVPSVVAVANPVPDALLHEVTGLAVPAPDPQLIADALQRMAQSPQWRRELGRQAKLWAEENFSIEVNAALMLELYRDLLSTRTRS
ncbi:glycosyltransferase family 4 protein [Pseudomonas sichuanensis]|uniref:glycosyltransferase family 4 protein n=1 Tax=Pseudomonas sichuanensis TaxID=2213015 RepID=UPI00215F82B3|nr:glycosyltransferase family 4 protein [Pseudomonas sichuanensis]MDZ4017815.1 D-inositol-3-phosphate glycosyltransferase [Pseudomonas sichuanensis]UVL90721.1 glycosyltransferase family 4 protein [Pseudomonas sichuanensis]